MPQRRRKISVQPARGRVAYSVHLLRPFAAVSVPSLLCHVPSSRQLELVEGYQRVSISPWPVLAPSMDSYIRSPCTESRSRFTTWNSRPSTRHSTRSRVTPVTWRWDEVEGSCRRGRAGQSRAWLADCSKTGNGSSSSLDRDRRAKRRPPTEHNLAVDCGSSLDNSHSNSHRGPSQTSTDL